jgi:hypothetical protein
MNNKHPPNVSIRRKDPVGFICKMVNLNIETFQNKRAKLNEPNKRSKHEIKNKWLDEVLDLLFIPKNQIIHGKQKRCTTRRSVLPQLIPYEAYSRTQDAGPTSTKQIE